MNYEELITENKKETNFENLQDEISAVEAFINKCLKFVCENTSSNAERDYNVTSM